MASSVYTDSCLLGTAIWGLAPTSGLEGLSLAGHNISELEAEAFAALFTLSVPSLTGNWL